MIYQKICRGCFLSRPNRFIAKVRINGVEETVHVKNTGRCRELLLPGATVILEDCEMVDADLCFERSSVNATLKGHVISVKNPLEGSVISAPSIDEIILEKGFENCQIKIG